MVCLDTSFVVDFIRGHPAARSRLEDLLRRGEPIAMAPVTLSYAYLGAIRRGRPRDFEAIASLRRFATLLPYNDEACRIFGEVGARLIAEGQEVVAEDLVIASVALAHGESVLTRDVRHFGRIGGLTVESC